MKTIKVKLTRDVTHRGMIIGKGSTVSASPGFCQTWISWGWAKEVKETKSKSEPASMDNPSPDRADRSTSDTSTAES